MPGVNTTATTITTTSGSPQLASPIDDNLITTPQPVPDLSCQLNERLAFLRSCYMGDRPKATT